MSAKLFPFTMPMSAEVKMGFVSLPSLAKNKKFKLKSWAKSGF